MAELLLELFSEEIPAVIQKNTVNTLEASFKDRLAKAGIEYKNIKAYATPRRLAVVVDGLPKVQKDSVVEKKGPRVDAPGKAVEGFLRSVGAASPDDLEKRKTDKGEFYFSVVKQKGQPVADVLKDVVKEVIFTYPWPKSMKWGAHHIRWTRPLHNILCLFDEEVLPVSFGHLNANNKSKGHRFLSPKEFTVKNFEEYKTKLLEHKVVLDSEERRSIIEKGADKKAKTHGLSLRSDPALLDEVVGLVEWPVVLVGNIDEKFLDVPQESLIMSMRSHQKYFSLLNPDGSLAPYFITVSNVETADKNQKIINGNERVLRARLEDAKFFWDQDRRSSLESRLPKLEQVVFHAKLGSVAEKTRRVSALAKLIAVWIPHANLVLVERAANLCKVDLTTEMVGEFPELQGLMGSYYAIESKETEEVASAIKDHYSPLGPNDSCPTAPVSVAVALADKVDTLTGLFAVDEKPTGSKDPYALRRAALGVIRIILENKLSIPLDLLFEKSLSKYPKNVLKSDKIEKGVVFSKKEKPKQKQERVIADLLEFFIDRLKFLLKAKNVRHDLLEAVFNGGNESDLARLVERVEALSHFVESEDGRNLIAAYKRATNIVVAEEKRDGISYTGNPDKDLLKKKEEKYLYGMFTKIRPKIADGLKRNDFAAVMSELSSLRMAIDKFFENVVVNCDDGAIRKNRLLLLSQFRSFLNQVANFSKIESS